MSIKGLKNKLAGATDPDQQARINTRIGFLKNKRAAGNAGGGMAPQAPTGPAPRPSSGMPNTNNLQPMPRGGMPGQGGGSFADLAGQLPAFLGKQPMQPPQMTRSQQAVQWLNQTDGKRGPITQYRGDILPQLQDIMAGRGGMQYAYRLTDPGFNGSGLGNPNISMGSMSPAMRPRTNYGR